LWGSLYYKVTQLQVDVKQSWELPQAGQKATKMLKSAATSLYLSSRTRRKIMKDTKLRDRLKEAALLFLKLGAFSFGGPAVFIALMHQETVRRWGGYTSC